MRVLSRLAGCLPSAACGIAVAFTGVACIAATPAPAPATQVALHITLRSGFDITCDHAEQLGEKTRLYLHANSQDYMDVTAADIVSAETIALPLPAPVTVPAEPIANLPKAAAHITPVAFDLHHLASAAGAHNDLDADLIAAIVKQESSGNPNAISRAGARGLMQLMPGTAAQQGVADSFDPGQNVEGGTAYFNGLLLRYHDNLALALAAYNAGPAAVDKYHGIPPYRETRAYVARIIHDFNRRKAELAREQRKIAMRATATLAVGVAN